LELSEVKNVFIENSVSSFEDFHDSEWVSDLLCAGDNAGCGELLRISPLIGGGLLERLFFLGCLLLVFIPLLRKTIL